MEHNCSICKVLQTPFLTLSADEQMEIVNGNRPTENVEITNIRICNGETHTRNFHQRQFKKNSWLCGCSKRKKLFCWPCLLFLKDPSEQSVWTSGGFDDLSHMSSDKTRHIKSQSHIACVIDFNLFTNIKIENDVIDVDVDVNGVVDNNNVESNDSIKFISIKEHNTEVERKRLIAKRLIDAVCYLGIHEIHDRQLSMLEFLSKYDSALCNYINAHSVGEMNKITMNLIACVEKTIYAAVTDELNRTQFMTILIDQMPDERQKIFQFSVVFRYVIDEQVIERFVGFYDFYVADHSATIIATFLIELVRKWKCENKFIAYTYDGAAIKMDGDDGLQQLIENVFPRAIFVHCCSHNLNMALAQTLSSGKECKIFFANLSALAEFFINANQSLMKFLTANFAKIVNLKWDNKGHFVNIVLKNRLILITIFEYILNNPNGFDDNTIFMASIHLRFLKAFLSVFLLETFDNIFSPTKSLDNALQQTDIDIIKKSIKSVNRSLTNNRIKFQETLKRIVEAIGQPRISGAVKLETNIDAYLENLYTDIHNKIDNDLAVRFKSINHLEFWDLLNSNMFVTFSLIFPRNGLSKMLNNSFDIHKLRNELQVVYESHLFVNKNLVKILQMIKTLGVQNVLSQVKQLAELIMIIPFCATPAECTYDMALKRIKNYAKNSNGSARTAGLVTMVIEKDLLKNMMSRPEFYDNVILFNVENDLVSLGCVELPNALL